MKTFLLLLLAVQAWAANYNCASNATGNYDSAAIWNTCNGGIPNNGADTFTFTVSAGHTVTIPAGVEATVGQSLAANTAQGTLANTGRLVLAAGTATDPTILTMKGDLGITRVLSTCSLDSATNCNGVEMNPGTVIKVDSDGSGTSYAIGPISDGSSRWFKADCTDATSMPAYNAGTTYQIGYRVSYGGVNYISVADSNTGNTPHLFDSAYWQKGNCAIISVGATNAVFSRRGTGFGGGNVYFRDVAMKNFGTASVDAIAAMPNASNNPVGGADIMRLSCMNCGLIDIDDGDRTATSVHRLSNSIIRTINSGLQAVKFVSSSTAMTSGIREFKENVLIDGTFNTSGSLSCYGCTVEGNYVTHSSTNTPGYNWGSAVSGVTLASFKGNFVLKNNATQSGINLNVPLFEYNYIVNGPAINNQNSINLTNASTAGTSTVARYNVAALLNGENGGDNFVLTQSTNGINVEYSRNSQELNRDNVGAGNLITDLGISSPGGTDNHVYKNNFMIGTTYAIAMETSVHWAGSVTAQNNTFARWASTGTMSKILDVASCTLNPNDVCSAAGCNYNLGADLSATPPGGCTNAHNGYILDLSAASGWGANDLNLSTLAEAQFADLTRTFATAATEFFGQSATAGAWSNASVSYVVGDIVSDSQSIWQGKTVLYRALAAHTSADTSRPGNGATWQTACGGGPCWEYATSYFLREKIAKGERWTDASIGAVSDYIPQAMVKWHLHGRISHRRDLQCMGSDGESPWPIPYCEQGRAVAGAITSF